MTERPKESPRSSPSAQTDYSDTRDDEQSHGRVLDTPSGGICVTSKTPLGETPNVARKAIADPPPSPGKSEGIAQRT